VIFLGGCAPGDDLIRGDSYDVRFLQDRIAIFPQWLPDPVAELAYASIETVDIGGPGLVKTGGGFIGGGLGVTGAVEGMAIAALLNALTTQVTVKTIVRIQAAHSEIFLLHGKLTPDALRIELSRPLGLIRAARTAPSDQGRLAEPASVIDQLAKLAAMLEAGPLTRDECDQLKAQLITGKQ